jgi:acyl-CoA thioesterase
MSPNPTSPGHAFDRALQLQPIAEQPNRWRGEVSADYWNMVGPFGGMTAATALQAVLGHPERLGQPVALTVNYVAPLARGPFVIEVRPVRTNRSTQHWLLSLSQTDGAAGDAVVLTASAMTALRRDTWGEAEALAPQVPKPAALAPYRPPQELGWAGRYELRPIMGDVPSQWDGRQHDSLSQLWVRDQPPRALDFPGLAAMADIFFPRVWLRRATLTPAGTTSLTVYFHADAAMLARAGSAYLLGQARGQAYFKGFHDQSAQLWSEQGELLATTHQVVYYKG